MAYDTARREVVLFGGYDGTEFVNDTWVWDGTNWTEEFPNDRPGVRNLHAMAYAGALEQVMLFGGWIGAYKDDTWLWQGSNWTQFNASDHPSPRREHAMAEDSSRGEVVLFSGLNAGNDTWVFGCNQ